MVSNLLKSDVFLASSCSLIIYIFLTILEILFAFGNNMSVLNRYSYLSKSLDDKTETFAAPISKSY